MLAELLTVQRLLQRHQKHTVSGQHNWLLHLVNLPPPRGVKRSRCIASRLTLTPNLS